jgi:hypothetical protein
MLFNNFTIYSPNYESAKKKTGEIDDGSVLIALVYIL